MRILLVSGPWGSGTTAVAGLLARLGAVSFGPYFRSYDPRTPITYEFVPFRDVVRRHVCVPTLSRRNSTRDEVERDFRALRSRIEEEEFGPYSRNASLPVLLKSPPSAFLLPEICMVFDVWLILVKRPLEQIEQSRLRRGWEPHFGRLGAEVIYRHLSSAIETTTFPHIGIEYEDVLNSPMNAARRFAAFAHIEAGLDQIEAAACFVKSGRLPST